MKMVSIKTTQQQLKRLNKGSPCQLSMVAHSRKYFTGLISGPAGTPYEGGIYRLFFDIPKDFPDSPPKVRFTTKVWHPNIDSETGAICLKQFTWTRAKSGPPIYTLRVVMKCLRDLLSAPEPDDPVDAFVASQYKENRRMFESTAQYWAHKFADAPRFAFHDDFVKKIVGLGFREAQAVKSLSKCNFILKAAIDDLCW